MEGIEVIQKKLQSKEFSFSLPIEWCGIPYMLGDYYYHPTNKIVARYIFVHVNINGWRRLYSEQSSFMSDVVEDIYYSLDKDLRWSLYLICVVNDEDLTKIDRYEKRNFENNINYTRNFLVSESMLAQRIPVGKVLVDTNQYKIQYPIEEWQIQLGEYSFCMESLSEGSLFYNLLKWEKDKGKEQNNARKNIAFGKGQIQELSDIRIPKMFRPHLYQKEWVLPCCKFNLLFGANGTGKTSVLSAIELAFTGKVYKPERDTVDNANQADVELTILKQDRKETLKKPNSLEEEIRESEWYNSHNEKIKGSRLNPLFHRFNYFSIDDSDRFARFFPKMEDVFSRLLYGEDTIKIWENIRQNYEKSGQIIVRLQQEYESINVQMQQSPPNVDEIYEERIRQYITESRLRIPTTIEFYEVVKIIDKIQHEIMRLTKNGYIVSKTIAEKRLEEINRMFPSIDKQGIMLERRIKKYRFFQSSVGKFTTVFAEKRDKKIQNWEIQKEQNANNRLKLINEKAELQQIIEFWEKLSTWVPSTEYEMSGEELGWHCKRISKAIAEFNQFQDYLIKLSNLAQRREEVAWQITSFEKLRNQLDQLSSPKKYAEKFISNNIMQISQIFINLHMPQEFSALKMENGEMVGIRGQEIVPIGNMSTGQRTALAISILFQLHLSNPTVPQFILIDEPMARIDAMNSLLLIDFLRELVIVHNRQIFVTTMDRNTAMLFRRKFSFLCEDFQEISFDRQSKGLYQIKQKKYNQKQLISEIDI